jgi:hypothetical protein
VKFKLKFGRLQWILVIAVVVVVAALLVHRSKSSGPSGPGMMDSHASQACGDFSDGYPKAKTKSARLSLADKVTGSSSKSDNGTIRDKAMAIGRNADDNRQWKTSATALLDACRDAGFKG